MSNRRGGTADVEQGDVEQGDVEQGEVEQPVRRPRLP
jgi:hypothetical protein